MPKKRSWTDEELIAAVAANKSYRAVLIKLRLIPAGGNYEQVHRRVRELNLTTDHFTGMRWNTGLKLGPKPRTLLADLLVKSGEVQSLNSSIDSMKQA